MTASITLDSIKASHALMHGHIEQTPFLLSRKISQLVPCKPYLKYENHQYTSSFKERGAFVKLHGLPDDAREKGVVAMSAGNHAQAVAYHAQQMGIPVTIVMPRFTPSVKIRNTRNFGAHVQIVGDSLEEAGAFALGLCAQQNMILIHPYDDPLVIQGQGTIALEMLHTVPDLDALLIPVGGGGLIAGNAIAAKSLNPKIKIYGVETKRYPSMHQALNHEPIECGRYTLAEGIGVKQPGELTREIIAKWVDDIFLVGEESIEEAVLLLLESEKTVVEGAGAVPLAALVSQSELFRDQKVGLILSGGNIDLPILSTIIKRGLDRTGRLVRLSVSLRDKPGALAKLCTLIGELEANIVQLDHQRTFTRLPLESVQVVLVLQTRGSEHLEYIQEKLNRDGYDPRWTTI